MRGLCQSAGGMTTTCQAQKKANGIPAHSSMPILYSSPRLQDFRKKYHPNESEYCSPRSQPNKPLLLPQTLAARGISGDMDTLSCEHALPRTLDIPDKQRPAGRDWHNPNLDVVSLHTADNKFSTAINSLPKRQLLGSQKSQALHRHSSHTPKQQPHFTPIPYASTTL